MKYSGLSPKASPLSGNEQLAVADAGLSKRVNVSQIAALGGPKGDPGGSLFSPGTLAWVKTIDVLDAHPGVARISLDDRGGAWRVYVPGEALPAGAEDIWWFEDLGGTIWRLDVPMPYATMGGADPTGTVDSSVAIARMSQIGPVHLAAGTYLWETPINPNIENVFLDPGVRVDSPVMEDIMPLDDEGRLIGLAHNFLEQRVSAVLADTTPILTGAIRRVPLARPYNRTGVTCMAALYNDFGLWRTLLHPTQGHGDRAWYDGRWNFHDADTAFPGFPPQQPERTPEMGHIRGDDPLVLDRMIYDLVRFGFNAVSLLNSEKLGPAMRDGDWEDPADYHHWFYQMWQNAPNFKQIAYAPSGFCSYADNVVNAAHVAETDAYWESMIFDVIGPFPNAHVVRVDNKVYASVYVWSLDALRGTHDGFGSGDTAALHTWLAHQATRLRQLPEFDGLHLMAREAVPDGDGTGGTLNRTALRAQHVIITDAGYSEVDGEDGTETSYEQLVDHFEPPAAGTITNIAVGRDSHPAHSTNFLQPGATPELFERLDRAALRGLMRRPDLPQIIHYYAATEFAEGGPNLVANRLNKYAYLQAHRRALSELTMPSIP